LSIAALVFVSTVFAQTEEPPLHSDSTVPVKLAGGAERLWRISLPEVQTANLEIVEQQSSPSDGSAAQAKKEVDGWLKSLKPWKLKSAGPARVMPHCLRRTLSRLPTFNRS
jgi:hypothetical protein